jgi:hypothetical protein
MSKSAFWYGFLQAGEKSSPVVRDMTLQTKNPKTIYLYNHVRGDFLEYSSEIVEPKLRELNPDDVPLKELQSAFRAARKAFVSGRVVKRWDKETSVATTAGETDPVPEDDFPVELMEDLEEDDTAF